MKKITGNIKAELKAKYDGACNSYLLALMTMWELEACYGYWNSDQPGTIYHYGETHNLTMEDIIYIVENDIEEDEVLAWEDYCLDAYEFNFSRINLDAWHRGCPRVPQDAIDRLRELRAELDKAVREEKERLKKGGEK